MTDPHVITQISLAIVGYALNQDEEMPAYAAIEDACEHMTDERKADLYARIAENLTREEATRYLVVHSVVRHAYESSIQEFLHG